MKSFFCVLIACAYIASAGCNRNPSECQLQCAAVIQQTFKGTAEGDYFAAEKILGTKKLRLVQFHKPRTSVLARPVTDTDRMNGVSGRCALTLTCEQFRYWDGSWTEWQQGSGGGGKEIMNALVGGAFGYWAIVLEKKNGQWTTRNMLPIHDFLVDQAQLASLMQRAGV